MRRKIKVREVKIGERLRLETRQDSLNDYITKTPHELQPWPRRPNVNTAR